LIQTSLFLTGKENHRAPSLQEILKTKYPKRNYFISSSFFNVQYYKEFRGVGRGDINITPSSALIILWRCLLVFLELYLHVTTTSGRVPNKPSEVLRKTSEPLPFIRKPAASQTKEAPSGKAPQE